jgi:hypothetical protein
MRMSSDSLNDLVLELDQRNLAHVFAAVALCGVASTRRDALADLSSCCWTEDAFVLRTGLTYPALMDTADGFVRSIRWVEGLGSAEQGTFHAGDEVGSNPFISLADNGQETSPVKTFSGQVTPASLLFGQQALLIPPDASASWLEQMNTGVRCWGFDHRVSSHAYDRGFSSDAEGTGSQDPVFPAIELLTIAALAFCAEVHGWQARASTIRYFIWDEPISLALVPYAVAARLGGLAGRPYVTTDRGAAYGKGAAYRFFPEATLEHKDLDNDRR